MSDLFARKCAGKKRHDSERRALDWAKKTKHYTGCSMNAYECPFCKRWHVGSALYANGRTQRLQEDAA